MFVRARLMSLCLAATFWLLAPADVAWAQDPQQPDAGTQRPAQETDLQSEEELYILKDVEKPEPEEPKLDLGKVGEKGELTIERMPVNQPGTYEGEPKQSGRAGGVRLRIPLGNKPAE